jgi:CheY-like chemotaxis protein
MVVRVLVVEDERDLREGIAEVLQEEGYEVATAENGAIGLDRAREFAPEVILLDLMMPVMNGYQFLESQQGDPALSHIPVVVVSAVSRSVRARTVVEHVSKPFSIVQLLSIVERAGPHPNA